MFITEMNGTEFRNTAGWGVMGTQWRKLIFKSDVRTIGHPNAEGH